MLYKNFMAFVFRYGWANTWSNRKTDISVLYYSHRLLGNNRSKHCYIYVSGKNTVKVLNFWKSKILAVISFTLKSKWRGLFIEKFVQKVLKGASVQKLDHYGRSIHFQILFVTWLPCHLNGRLLKIGLTVFWLGVLSGQVWKRVLTNWALWGMIELKNYWKWRKILKACIWQTQLFPWCSWFAWIDSILFLDTLRV